jgi:nucleolar protein 14
MGKAKRAGARRQAPRALAGARGGTAKANPNPFEVKVNRQKFQVLGRKTRHDVGLPGVSRARAIRKVRGDTAVPWASCGLLGPSVFSPELCRP